MDGQAVDTCFHCALLYPDEHADDCPRCGRRMRYRPATLTSDAALRDSVRRLLADHAGAPASAPPGARLQRLIALLEHLHTHAPASLTILQELGGPGLDDLRRDYERLLPPHP